MTLRNNPDVGGFTVDCDQPGCHKNLELEGDFDTALKALKEAGWYFAKQGGEWRHFCLGHEPRYHRGVARRR